MARLIVKSPYIKGGSGGGGGAGGYVEAWDYYSKGIFQYTRYCVASL